MLDTLNKLSHDATLELIDTYLSTNTKNEPKTIEFPYEYLNSLKTTLQYSNLYSNASLQEGDFLIRFAFSSLENQGKYTIELHNTNSEYTFEINQIVIKMFKNEQKVSQQYKQLYKYIECSGEELKTLKSKIFEYSYDLNQDSTHIDIQITGQQAKNMETQINQKDLLKMQTLIKQSQDQGYELEKQKTVVDLLNMFQKALSSARSARESAGSSSNQQQIKIQMKLSTSELKLYNLLKFDERNYNNIKKAEAQSNILTLRITLLPSKLRSRSIPLNNIYFNSNH